MAQPGKHKARITLRLPTEMPELAADVLGYPSRQQGQRLLMLASIGHAMLTGAGRMHLVNVETGVLPERGAVRQKLPTGMAKKLLKSAENVAA